MADGFDHDGAGEMAVRARVKRDYAALTPAAQQRYRMALRDLKQNAGAPATLSIPLGGRRISAADIGLGMLAAFTVAMSAAFLGAFLAGMVGAAALTALVGLSRLAPPEDAGPAPRTPQTALELHLAAMAQSRRAYYLDERVPRRRGMFRTI